MIPILFAIPGNEALAALLSRTAHWDAPTPHRKKRGTATMTGTHRFRIPHAGTG